MKLESIALIALIIVSVASISAILLIPDLRELIFPKNEISVEEEYYALIKKSYEAPPYKADYLMSISMPNIFGYTSPGSGLGINYSFDVTNTYFSKSLNKVSLLISVFGVESETEIYNVNGKSIKCQKTNYSSIYSILRSSKESEWFCEISKESFYSIYDPSKAAQSIDLTKKIDYNITFIGEKKIVERDAKCYKLDYSGKDINISWLQSIAYLAATDNGYSSITGEPPKIPTAFSLVSEVNNEKKEDLYEEIVFNAEVCLDKQYGVLALMDSNFSIKMKNLKKPIGFSLKFNLKKIEFGKVSEQHIKPPVPFSIDANCNNKNIKLMLTAFEDLKGQARLTLSKESYWIAKDYEESSIRKDSNIEFEKNLGEISIKAFDSRSFKIALDKNISYGSKEIRLCIGEKCQKSKSYGCYISSFSKYFYILSATCSDANIYFSLYSYDDVQGNLKARLKDGLSYETIFEKDFGYVSLESYKKKSFEFKPETELSGSGYLEVCVDDDCYDYYCSKSSYGDFYASNLTCDQNKVSFTLYNTYATKDYSGDLTIKGYSDYYRKSPIFDKNMGLFEIKAGKTKKVSVDVEKDISSYNTIYLNICIGKNCDKTSCYPTYYGDYTFPPLPTVTPEPEDVNIEAKVQNCITGTTDITIKEYCLSTLMSYYGYSQNPKTAKNILPLCDAIKKFTEDNISKYNTMENYGFLYNVPNCYATYGFYSGVGSSICDKLPDKDINIVQYGSINIIVKVNWRNECKQKYASLLATK
ncbi:MAG: hypothetical protein N3F05_00935 [Candidatus Diapherotrites archaeon]|nr:hypothetical protein [Candidatus Diapherotrites archaeon]